jgi:iron complex outermembrane receptor protein
MKINTFQLFFFICSLIVNAQQNKPDTLQEVVITSSRIDLPFKENSRTIQLITAEDIKNPE